MLSVVIHSISSNTPIQYIKGVGPALAELLRRKDIYTVQDALYFLPRTYEDREHFKPIAQLTPGQAETSFGTIRRIALVPMKLQRKKILTIAVADSSGTLLLKWFHYNPKYMMTRFKVGMHIVFRGEVKIFKYQKEITHPDLEVIEDTHSTSLHFGRIVPVYSETEGLYQKTIRRILNNVLLQSLNTFTDPLPPEIKERHHLPDLSQSFQEIHFPKHKTSLDLLLNGTHPARRRLVFDEFFFLELGLALKRSQMTQEKGIPFPSSQTFKSQLISSLPFELTPGQKTALLEIEEDLKRPTPMNRLLQGDVGSGKTLVAILSALTVLEHHHQVALMVPTEILAEQHFKTLTTLLSLFNIKISLLTSDMKKNERSLLLDNLKKGEINFIVGTHALIQEDVEFFKLGFVIVDEQHRFGVEQRLVLKQKGFNPHLLVMTATPIPRTLALTVYGDLDISLMQDMPKGRKPIKTKVIHERQRLQLYDFMKKECAKGRQAYVIYPLIEESEKIDLKDATQMAEHLKNIFTSFRVELLHGKMSGEEKKHIMEDFKNKKIHLLVSTTVIEVGIDVPNSTIMVVEHPERFGLSQLHQLRGRIGRGSEMSYCFLLSQYAATEESKIRLKAMEEHLSGFKIAEVDLKLRGPGEFLGTRQSGLPGFRVANLITDTELLIAARSEAFNMVSKDPQLSLPQHQPLKEALRHHWQHKINFINAG
ncbi:MAG: ATP-dependent DNA helicase RecG [Deltaproteobacteria bacterium GWA2_38_16]|nr:MAG: ATP-dependent DNA helicase RecG [Deltaproteobacteria bacterium GWA2_38_16]OGQ03191.1 MAG: ATP-dependent DNA helicase RecG [Deltaproteobacteria bacterium RIFCSPHIGHO2_02_FULL_38_15]